MIVALTFVVLAVASVVVLWVWGWRLRRRGLVPMAALCVGYGLILLATLLMAATVMLFHEDLSVPAGSSAVQQTAQASLAISEAAYNSALGLVIALVAAAWLAFCARRWR